MFKFFFFLSKSKNLLKFGLKTLFWCLKWFMSISQISWLCQNPKITYFAKNVQMIQVNFRFFLLISIKNMTFYGSHATQEQKMSKMFRRDHKSNFLHLIEIWPPLSGPFSCLIIIKKYSEPVQREIFVMRSLSCFNE